MRVLTLLVSLAALLLISCSTNDPETYILSVTSVPEGAGSVTPATGEFEEGREVEISAESAEGWRFDQWQGDIGSGENPTVITMDSDKDIAALFVKQEYALTIETIGEGEVSEQVVTGKTTDYESGTRVELTAEPAEGWEFTRWEGDLESSENPETVTIESPTEITAVFSKVEYPLTINIVGNGSVDQEVITSKVTDYELGTEVQLTAVPDDEYMFSEWTGDLESDENPVTITIDGPKTVTATFLRTFKLTTLVNPEGAGTITPDSGRYVRDETFEVEATPEPGWEFTRWEGDLESTENPETVTIESPTEIIALFSKVEYPLTINTVGNGSVDQEVIASKVTDYELGTEVQLTAVPDDEYLFSQWTGDLESDENPVTITIDDPKTVTATFLRTFKLTTLVNPEGAGSISPDSGRYVRDETFEVEATPEPGWKFTNWEGDFTSSVNPFDLTMNGNKTLLANFERQAFVLDTTVTGNGQIVANLLSGTETEEGFLFESEVELTAVPIGNWNFVRWEGDIERTENPITVSMDQDISLVAVFSIFDEGDGSLENPYQLSSVLQLQEVQNHLDAHFIQTANIDAFATATWNNSEGFEPIGDDVDSFTGSYNGGGFEITGLTINRPDDFYLGLFGYIDGANISNVSLQAIDFNGEERVGGIAGVNAGIIDSVSVEGAITSNSITGGVTGRNLGLIENAETTVTISGADNAGGLVGINSSVIVKSYSLSTIENSMLNAGGFAGINSGRIEESYADGSVEGTENIGGFLGLHNPGGVIKNSYSLANVTGTDIVGGFVANNGIATEIEFSYAAGVVNGTDNTGGFIGVHSSESTILNGNYWDTETSGFTEGVGTGDDDDITGLTTAEMTGVEAENNMDAFDWTEIWITSTSTTDYPVLRWQEEQ